MINGPGPLLDDEDDAAATANAGRMSMMNPMMGAMNIGVGGPMSMGLLPMSFSSPGLSPMWASNIWQQQQQQQAMAMRGPMITPAPFMMPPPTEPALFAAHQQAMMIAKQAYQMAVAQQAMMAAGEEWERGSAVGGFSSSGSVMGGVGVGWTGQQQMLAAGLRPPPFMGMGSSQSDYGGAGSDRGFGAGLGWNSSRSVYGETFGRPTQTTGERERVRLQKALHPGDRDSEYFAGGGPPVPPVPTAPGAGGKAARLRTTSGPASVFPRPKKSASPPSSWRAKGDVPLGGTNA